MVTSYKMSNQNNSDIITINKTNYKSLCKQLALPYIKQLFEYDPYCGYYDYTDYYDAQDNFEREIAEYVRSNLLFDPNDTEFDEFSSKKYRFKDETMMEDLYDGYGLIYDYVMDLAGREYTRLLKNSSTEFAKWYRYNSHNYYD